MPTPPDPAAPYRRYASPRVAWTSIVVLVITLPLFLALPVLTPLLLVPLVFGLWLLRSETHVDPEGVSARGLLRTRRLRWDEVDVLRLRRRALVGPVRVEALDGRTLDLPHVTPADVADLRAIAEGRPLRPAQ